MWVSFAARYGRNYITSSSSSSSSSTRRIPNPNKVIFSNFLSQSSSSSTSCNPSFTYRDNDDNVITASKDFQKVMSLLSNASTRGRRYNKDLTNLVQHHQQNFLIKVIETSCQTKLAETLKVPPQNLIYFIKMLWKDNKDLIDTHVLEYLVESISTAVHYDFNVKLRKKYIFFLWDMLKKIGRYETDFLNARILNKLIESFSVMGQQGKAALDVFHNFDVFQCVPNQDTYYYTLQALLRSTRCSADMIHQTASIYQKLLLLHDDDQEEYNHLLPCYDDDDKVTTSESFQRILTRLSDVPVFRDYRYQIKSAIKFMDFATPRHHQQHFLLKIIKTSCQTKFVETPPHNLIRFVELVWKNNKNLITTPVLESLVLSICPTAPTEYDVALKKKDILYLWNLLKHIGHYQTGILNTRILNQLIGFFRYMGGGRRIVGGYSFYGYIWDKGKAALDVFHKFEVFQCVPNQDTYIFTLQAICDIDYSTDVLQQAASICQKMVLHPDTLLPDGEILLLGSLLTWFSKNNMIKEASALYWAAKEKWKRNPNWGLALDRMLPHRIFEFGTLCSRKETVYLALDLLTVIDFPQEVEHQEEGTKLLHCRQVITGLCRFKDFDAAKQLIFKMIADGPLPRPSKYVFNVIIKAYVDAGEIGQALEMVMLLESIGLRTYDALMCGNGNYYIGMKQAKEILEEAKKKDSKLIVALLYHMLIFINCKLQNYDKALNLLTEMKDYGLSINLDEYHKLIHPLCLNDKDRDIVRMQLWEMESMDRRMAKEKLEEIHLNIRASFS